MKVTNTDIFEHSFDWDSDKIIVNTMSDRNLLLLARQSEKFYDIYNSLLNHDFILYMHNNNKSFFCKRKFVNTLWKRTDLIQQGGTFYTLESPLKENRYHPKRLVVIFSSMPSQKNYFSANIANRMFTKNYPSLPKHLMKNCYTLRIMDLNRSFGSYYLNTKEYQDFEKDVQDIIDLVQKQLSINKDDVVLYGGSKGGTGALYHSILGDYHAVVVDPIFSRENYNSDKDVHFLEKSLPVKLTPLFQEVLKKDKQTREKKIICTPAVDINYNEYVKLESEYCNIVRLLDDHMLDHVSISPNSVVEQVTYINNYFMNSENYKKSMTHFFKEKGYGMVKQKL